MDLASASVTARAPSRAAQYVRMSTEHQQYSPENQLEIIRQYAADHNMEIVQDYSDHGRSGLNIAGREGLTQLMADVEAKRTNFTSLLVYDVSRWGRFQDVDESAYYEYVLKRAGIRVHYCAEQFENDGSMSSSVLKTLKRSMAAEYSRELLLHGGDHVAVEVHRDSDLAVAQNLHDDAGVHALRQQQRGARVSQIMEAHARQAEHQPA